MRRALGILVLSLCAAACSGNSDDDGVVMFRDGGTRDGGAAPRDGGVINVVLEDVGGSYSQQGCSNGCQIWMYRASVRLGNQSQYFQVSRVTSVRIEIGSFIFEQSGLDCDGTWWKAPKMGSTSNQLFIGNIFDVAEDDDTRPDNAFLEFDCQAADDIALMPTYQIGDKPSASTTVKATLTGELEDGTVWEATGEGEATPM